MRRGGWWLAATLAASLLVVMAYPSVWTVALSLSRSTLGRPLQRWVGFDNFAAVLAAMAPVFVIGLSFQRRLVAGLVTGAVR